DDAVAQAFGQKMVQFAGGLHGSRQQEPIEAILIDQLLKPLGHILKKSTHVRIGLVLEAGLGEQMVGAAGFDAAHKVRRQHFLVLFNFTDKNSKEPGVGFIDEYDAVALVLIE